MATLNLNKVILVGRLTKDPELKQTTSGISVVTVTVAVNRNFSGGDKEDVADFIPVVAWRKSAEFIAKHFAKGNSICIIGSIQTRNWTDSNDQKRFATEVIADEVRFVDPRHPDAQEPQPEEPITDIDGDLPF